MFRANVSAALADPKPKAAMAELIITFEVPHLIQPLVELYGGCMVVLKVT